MRLTLYYITHAVKNQIRKLCRTWVAVFLLACLLIGVIFGVGAAALASLFEEETPPDEVYEEVIPEEEFALDENTKRELIELAIGAIVLVVFVFSALTADKSGSSIFLMADVNLLFQAPLRPQTVLLFRLIMQAGTSFFATLYLLFQIPNLVLNVGLGIGAAFAMLGAWFMLMCYAKLISVFLYTLLSTRTALKKYLRPTLYVLLGILVLLFVMYMRRVDTDPLLAASRFFNAPITRYIPVWGWLKGLVMYTVEENVYGALLSFVALLLFAACTVWLIRRLKADFYEEAMARSEETAALHEAQQNANALKKRKKDRGDALRRDGLCHGLGAGIYFHKAMYNRFRFAYLRVFTKTSLTYLTVALGISSLMIFAFESFYFPPVALVLAGFAFFRALGNPIAGDVAQESFFMVPDTAHRKVFFSFAAGVVNSAFDLLPAFLVAAFLLRSHPAEALMWFLLILSVGTFADSIGMFIDLSLSTALTQTVKSLVQILFIYFGLAPTAILLILGFAFDKLILFTVIATVLNLAITALSLAISPLFIEHGRR